MDTIRESYILWTRILLGGGLAALVAAVGFFVAALIGWRGPRRKRWLKLSIGCALLLPLAVGAQQYLLWRVILPAFGREQMRQMRVAREASLKRGEESSLVKVGDPAPTFSIADVQGRTFDLAEQRGKVVLLNFFATWCGPCQMELPHVQKFWDQQREREDVVLLVVGREESTDAVVAFQKERHFTFPAAADPERKVYGLFAKQLIPRTYVIGRDGTITYAASGFMEGEFAQVEEAVAQALRAPRAYE